MSRGFGSMQRQILQIYDASLVAPPPRWCGRDDWRDYKWLREEVARRRGVWCERAPCPCMPPTPGIPNLAKYPHINFWEGGALRVAFARAVRTLITQGVLVAGTWHSGPAPVGPWQRILSVARVKCSKQF